jgi:hypothetical protein
VPTIEELEAEQGANGTTTASVGDVLTGNAGSSGIARGRVRVARDLLKKLVEEAAAFSVVSRKTLAAIDRNNTATDKRLDRVAQLVPVLKDAKEYEAVNKVKKLAEEPHVELRRASVQLIGELGTKDDIGFLRSLRDRADNTAIHVRAEIEDAIRKLEER